MAGSCIVAIESRKHAARRPSPPLPRPASGSCFKQAEPIEVLLLDRLPGDGIEQEVRHIVGQRAADEKLHRQVIDALGVLALIGVLREHPALREDVPDGAGKGLEAFSRAHGGQFDDVVEDQVPLVKRVVRPRELAPGRTRIARLVSPNRRVPLRP